MYLINSIKNLNLIMLIVITLSLAHSISYSKDSIFTKNKIYSIGVVPQLIPTETHRIWAPIVAKLTQLTGLQFELKLYDSIPKFEVDFLNGVLDLAFLNPYHAVMAKKTQAYIPLIRDSAQSLSGILVVKKDSNIKFIKDLDGKSIAFPAPNSFGASLYLRALLTQKYQIKFTPIYQKTHSNVYRHVIFGEALAGGGVNNTLKREASETQMQLRILFETPSVPSHPIVAHPRLSKKIIKLITDSFLEMGKNTDSQKLFDEAQLSKPIKAIYDIDYKPLEKLKLEKFVVLEKF